MYLLVVIIPAEDASVALITFFLIFQFGSAMFALETPRVPFRAVLGAFHENDRLIHDS